MKVSYAKLLRSLGMLPKYRGYAYLLYIFKMTTEHPEYIYQLSKTVYPLVMENFKIGKTSVERNIRFAIKRAWESGDKDELDRWFGKRRDGWPPTNAEFISTLTFIAFEDTLPYAYQTKMRIDG